HEVRHPGRRYLKPAGAHAERVLSWAWRSVMAVVLSFEQLLQFLVDNKVPHNRDLERQLIELPSNAAPLPGNRYLRWEKSVPFLQIIHFMIENVPVDRIRELETAIIRLDNKLEVGGFGFDHDMRKLYCRLVVPVYPHDGLNPMTLDKLTHGVVSNA